MIKYYCDLCKEEIWPETPNTYILPQLAPYEAIAPFSEKVFTYEKLKDKELQICNSCQIKIAKALKQITKGGTENV